MFVLLAFLAFAFVLTWLILGYFDGQTRLHKAVLSGNQERLQAALKAVGVQLEARDSGGSTALHLASTLPTASVRMIELLLHEGANTEAIDKEENTPLLRAVATGNALSLAALLETGAKREARDSRGRTPLLLSCRRGDAASVKLLLRAGADKEARDTQGNKPLHLAVVGGDLASLVALLQAGANMEANDSRGNRPLHICATRCDAGGVKALLAAGADKEARDAQGNTPLHLQTRPSKPNPQRGHHRVPDQPCAVPAYPFRHHLVRAHHLGREGVLYIISVL